VLDTVTLVVTVPSAYDTEVAQRVLALAGYSVDTRVVPWARGLTMIKQGDADVLVNVFKTLKRMQFMYYGEEQVFHFKQFLYVQSDSRLTFNGNLAQLKDIVIGVRQGFSYGETFDSAIEHKIVTTQMVSTVFQNISMLERNRIDMFVENPMNMIAELTEQGSLELLDNLKMLRPAISSQPTYVVVSKKSRFGRTLGTDIDKALVELRATGQYAEILRSHFGSIEIQ
jgi:ABC-type amino acid transport substrate-binding protein